MKLTSENGLVTPSKPKFVPSKYQQDVLEYVPENLGQRTNLVINAVAGSGKTTLGIQLFNVLPKDMDSVFVAFNSHIAKELQTRLPEGANARTYHSLGLMTLKRTFPKVKVNADKVETFLRGKSSQARWMIPAAKRLVSLCKGSRYTSFDDHALQIVAFEHDIDLYDDNSPDAKFRIFDLVRLALADSFNNTDEVDFDDMIWLCNVRDDIKFYKYDFLFVDEVQDTNMGQLYLAMQSVSENGMIVGVGDRNQSIYAFRGADSTAIDKFKEALGADELPLSISYRCPTSVRDLVNQKFPEIKFETPDWAIAGKVADIMSYQAENILQPDDMVLCRVNADLIPLAFSLLRKGIKATVRGRDIGKGLITLIKKSCADDVPDLLRYMNNWRDRETQKAMALDSEDKIQSITDKYETLYAMTDGADTVTQVAERCETLFSDDRLGVTLSSVHRAKGNEANRVFILRPDLLPHPRAKTIDSQIQESNLAYISYTRSKNELYFVR